MEGMDPFSTSDLDEDDWSCSLTSRFTLGGKSLLHSLDTKPGGPRYRSRRCGEDKNILPLLGSEP